MRPFRKRTRAPSINHALLQRGKGRTRGRGCKIQIICAREKGQGAEVLGKKCRGRQAEG